MNKKQKQKPLSVEKFILVQVHDENDVHYGCMFQVGDVQGLEVHGFMVLPGRQMIFITTLAANVTPVGKCVNTSKITCSLEWSEKYGIKEEVQARKEDANLEDRVTRAKEQEPIFM